jgi:hypothetical protein
MIATTITILSRGYYIVNYNSYSKNKEPKKLRPIKGEVLINISVKNDIQKAI